VTEVRRRLGKAFDLGYRSPLDRGKAHPVPQ